MKKFSHITFVLILTGIGLSAPSSATEPTHAVVFNEIMWMGSFVNGNDKWIELRNTTDQEVDISGWLITKLSGGTEKDMLTLPDSMVIEPYGVFLMARYAADDTNSALDVEPDFVNSKVSFSKSPLQLKLYEIQGSDTTLVDVADDGVGSPPAGRDDTLKAAMVRQYSESGPPGVDNGTLPESWKDAEYRSGWDEGTTELGTPGSLEPATVKMNAAEHTVVLYDTFEVAISIEDIIDLFALNINAHFDSTVVRYLSTEGGDFLGSSPDTTIRGWHVGDTMNIGMSRLGPIGGVMGSGIVAHLKFKAIGPDSSRTGFEFDNVRLRNSNLQLIEVVPLPDSVTVVTLKVLDTGPDDGALNVINSTPIWAMFDNDPVILPTSTRFYLIPDEGGTATYDSTYKMMRLDPGSILADTMTYTAVLDSSFGMEEDYTWTFTTSIAGDIFDLDDPTDTDPFDDYIADGIVDGDDLGVLGYFYYSTPDSSYWSPVADLNKDNKVDGSDLAILGLHYGQTSRHYEGPPPEKPARGSNEGLIFALRYPEQPFQKDEPFQVEVYGEHMADLYAWTVYIPFDPTHVEVQEVQAMGPMTDRAALFHRIEKGMLNIGATRLGPGGGLNGYAPLAQITFKAKQEGPPHLTIGAATARDAYLRRIPVAIHSVHIAEIGYTGRPRDFVLAQNVPNPFNPITAIRYALPVEADVRLVIYNLNGQHVRTLVDGHRSAGHHVVRWDGTDDQRLPVASGLYIYRLEIRAPRRILSQKMLLLR